ncbi:hypothetical protein H6801_01485 [Candidatus Nomurabacteria bacterium]|nr:hypothetical protein [Candidatus Saccharibacteria bacterium]MCA9313669.1 hypothetical protein [Candidatus Saccharibacteria bacterium]MCB9822021.1 hypothetical protein [Candidatus Nomurabacteria bacterium]
MKYASVFATILLVWIAVIVMALFVENAADMFKIYVALMIFTLTLFIIGFGKNK